MKYFPLFCALAVFCININPTLGQFPPPSSYGVPISSTLYKLEDEKEDNFSNRDNTFLAHQPFSTLIPPIFPSNAPTTKTTFVSRKVDNVQSLPLSSSSNLNSFNKQKNNNVQNGFPDLPAQAAIEQLFSNLPGNPLPTSLPLFPGDLATNSGFKPSAIPLPGLPFDNNLPTSTVSSRFDSGTTEVPIYNAPLRHSPLPFSSPAPSLLPTPSKSPSLSSSDDQFTSFQSQTSFAQQQLPSNSGSSSGSTFSSVLQSNTALPAQPALPVFNMEASKEPVKHDQYIKPEIHIHVDNNDNGYNYHKTGSNAPYYLQAVRHLGPLRTVPGALYGSEGHQQQEITIPVINENYNHPSVVLYVLKPNNYPYGHGYGK